MERLRFDDRFFGEQNRENTKKILASAVQSLQKVIGKDCRGSEFTGWFDWPAQHGSNLATEIKTYCQSLKTDYDLVVVIGIGGSYAGTKAVVDALEHKYALARNIASTGHKPVVYAGHNLSERELSELLELLDQYQPMVNVISKSGTTTEPSVAFRVLRQYMEKRYGIDEASTRIIATTDAEKGALRSIATSKGYKTYVVPDDVGGRYSVLTSVGLVPLALAGYDIAELVAGADHLFSELKTLSRSGDESGLQEHSVLRYAASRKVAWEQKKRIEILAYGEPKLSSVVEWWKQLFGESEGKESKGLFPVGLSCTTDLHSLGQYVQEGCRNLVETFLLIDSDNSKSTLQVPAVADKADGLSYLEGCPISKINDAAMLATQIAHSDGDVPCLELNLAKLDEHHLGYLFAFYEAVCAVSSSLLGVNAFDQPGVEAYKQNLFGLMNKPGFEDVAAALKSRLQ